MSLSFGYVVKRLKSRQTGNRWMKIKARGFVIKLQIKILVVLGIIDKQCAVNCVIAMCCYVKFIISDTTVVCYSGL